LQAVQILGGSKETAMRSLQLHLIGAARSWLGKLKKETIGSLDELAKQFISNFKSTYKRPASTEELKACTQKIRGDTTFIHTTLEYNQKLSRSCNIPGFETKIVRKTTCALHSCIENLENFRAFN
jgi:hypothetical protein